ncbi:MAG: ROK family protein [Micromonosporaceae bacterium]
MVGSPTDAALPVAPRVAAPRSALTLLREEHVRRVLGLLRGNGPTSRAELSRVMKLSRSTLTNLTATLIATGRVIEIEPDADTRRGRGRPGTLLALNPAAGQTAGVDFGHRRVRVTLANLAHQVLATQTRGHPERTPWKRRVAMAAELMETIAAEHDIALDTLDGIGVGLLGPGDQHATRARIVTAELATRFGAPVVTDNNTRLAALAESRWGEASGLRNMLYIRLSHGVGGAVVLDGRVHRGAGGAAGEFGHICVDPSGPACWCGRHGCLECYASVPAVLRAWGGGHTIEDLRGALIADDSGAEHAVRLAGRHIGTVLAAICNALNPDDIVIGGELVAAGSVLLDAVWATLKEHTLPVTHRGLHLRAARLGDDDGALGAIALALGEPEAAHIAVHAAERTER